MGGRKVVFSGVAVLRCQRWWIAEIVTGVVGAQKSRRDALYPARSV